MERESDRQSNKVSKGKRVFGVGKHPVEIFLVTVKLARVSSDQRQLNRAYDMHEIR